MPGDPLSPELDEIEARLDSFALKYEAAAGGGRIGLVVLVREAADTIRQLREQVREAKEELWHYGQLLCEGPCEGGPVFDEKLFDCLGCRARTVHSKLGG